MAVQDSSGEEVQKQSRTVQITTQLLTWIHRFPYLTLIIGLLVTLGAIDAGRGLKLRTKIQDLLPDHAPSVMASRSLSDRLGSVDLLVLTLMTDDFDRVRSELPLLAQHLETLPEVRAARWRQDVQLINQNALITFPELEDLKQAYHDLVDEIKKQVSDRLTLFDEEDAEGSDDQAKRLLPQGELLKAEILKAIDEGDGWTGSWGEVESDSPLSKIGAQLRGLSAEYPEFFYNGAYTTIGLKVFPSSPSNDLQFCERVVELVEREGRRFIEERLGQINSEGVVRRFDVGGTYVNVLKQSKKIKGDMLTSTVASFSLLALVLLLAFRSVRGMFCVLVPLVMGTLWTVGVMSVTVGYLNLITAFIFAVLLGLGIDFGIHFFGRYREERALGAHDLKAMILTFLSCGHASILAASTTSVAFLALTLADFRGLSQFGGVAALGVQLCLLSVLIILPAIAFIWERWSPLRLRGYHLKGHQTDQDDVDDEKGQIDISGSSWVDHLGGRVALGGTLLGIVCLALAPLIQVELNFNRLGPHPKPVALQDEQSLSAKKIQYGTTKATSPTVAFASSPQEAKTLYTQIKQLANDETSQVKSVQSLYSLIPTQQKERIRWAKKLCRKLKRKYKLFKGDQRAGAEALLRHCSPQPFTEEDLPKWVIEQFTDRQGVVGGFLFISPRGSTSDGAKALAFHAQMQQIKTLDDRPPMIAGKTMVWAEVLLAMRRDGVLTFSVALTLVLLLLRLFERSWRGFFFVSIPLVLGIGLTVGIMAIFEIRLNFFNLLALPTLIGMGVDDGVHMHHRYRELGSGSASYLVKTTGRAAMLTTLTTSIGFASLMLADHRGLNSLGSLSVIGMCAALFSTLIILPAFFNWWDRRVMGRSTLVGGLVSLGILIVVVVMSGCEDSAPNFNEPEGVRRRDARVNTGPSEDQMMTGGQTSQDASPPPRDQYVPPPPDQMVVEMVQPCESPCDCMAGYDCISGVCTQGTEAIYCCQSRACPSGARCRDTSNRSAQCQSCTSVCDCAFGEACVNGQCEEDDTPRFCCERSPCPPGNLCETPNGIEMCPSGCLSACDCWGGQSCIDGSCQVTDEPSYCCERDLCPSAAKCEHPDGSLGRCSARACTSPCDCPTGVACVDGECNLSAEEGLTYCCEDIRCPFGRSCERLEGGMSTCVGEPECLQTCDCPSGTRCISGRCSAPDPTEELLLCCTQGCISGVECERLDGSRTQCP